ncbi:MAG: pilin [Patescibacteria group bacterium]|nr:pilin [Patescibacteria group bacterium]
MKIKPLFILLAALFVLSAPFFVRADLQLEQTYPSVGDEQLEQTVIKPGSDDPTPVIKYYATWAMIIMGLAALFSLIYGGVLYLTAAGRPAKAASGRKRIVGSFVGLAILGLAYLALNLINPRLNIMTIKKEQIPNTVLLISQEGIAALKATPAPSVKELIDTGKARYLSFDVADATKFVSALEVVARDAGGAPTKADFQNFHFGGLGFFSANSENLKVKVFAEKNFQGAGKTFGIKGLLNDQGEPVATLDKQPVQLGSDKIWVIGQAQNDNKPFGEFGNSAVECIDPQKNNALWNKNDQGNQLVDHPPLSFRIQGIGAGLYLYASDGSQIYASPNESGIVNVPEGTEITHLKLQNQVKKNGKIETVDSLAVVASGPNLQGNVRMFFGVREIWFPKLYLDEKIKMSAFNRTPYSYDDELLNANKGFYVCDTENNCSWNIANVCKNGMSCRVGNVPESADPLSTLGFSGTILFSSDAYGGGVKKIASSKIFELAGKEFAKVSGGSVCQEVRLCTQNNLGGICISYTPLGIKKLGLSNVFTLPMPWYQPEPIPYALYGSVDGANNSKDPARFSENIKSMKIEGDCLVALFSEHPASVESCVETMDSFDWTNWSVSHQIPTAGDCWHDKPASITEFFTKADNQDLLDLSENRISRCSGGGRGLNLAGGQSCAKGIVVFPLAPNK